MMSLGRRIYSGAVRLMLWASASAVCALLLWLSGCVLFRGVPGLSLATDAEVAEMLESVFGGTGTEGRNE